MTITKGALSPLVVSLLPAPIACLIAWQAAEWTAGPNISDVGVRMFAHGTAAIGAGCLTYVTISLAGLSLCVRACKDYRSLIWWMGGLVGCLMFLGFLVLLLFAYG